MGLLGLMAACAPGRRPGGRIVTYWRRRADRAMAVAVAGELAWCIRRNGAPDFPDPVLREAGEITIPGDVPYRPQSVVEAYKPIRARMPPFTVEGATL
ncbi:hypothetical protein ETD86_34265 [Nonomuraea turkmeniaca]|uniref:Uncharacterized protein n=1 Tax=Nonomuraea turkmeniaca TaxID=103838 RepID=A0A5S4F7M4_9ACTN|nr:hypothetical protein [Nonomuraea turkmeniaca]TMR11944.1 hypothetical protein ETD86_34265 [Nonomuraea turkmeniaca]